MTTRASRRRLLFGTAERLPGSIIARAGSLDVVLRAGKLWHIGVNELEVWHGVAFLYRDPHWRTPEPTLRVVKSDVRPHSFRVRWAGTFPTEPAIDVELETEGTAAGRIVYAATAKPRGDLATNRLGVCVMHPLAVCGRAIDVEHVDGRHSASTFPMLIPPWPPFTLVRAIRHKLASGQWARCEFSGDLFELEDQRNNGDASFKTYSRSNMAHRPYLLRGGQEVRQAVVLTLEQHQERIRARKPSRPVSVRCGAQSFPIPKIGLEVEAVDERDAERIGQVVECLNPAFLHVRVRDRNQSIDWKSIGKLLERGRCPLRVDLQLPESPAAARDDLEALGATLRAARIVPESVAVFPSEGVAIDLARVHFPRSAIGGGTPYFFAQLNRLENLGRVDFLSFTTSSIVHGTDDDIVMCGLQSLPAMVRTLEARYPGTPIRIGPSAIAAPMSPLGRSAESDGTSRVALAKCDPRTKALFGAAWLLGYVSQFATTGIHAMTLLAFTGSNGVVSFGTDGDLVKHPAYFVLQRLTRASSVYAANVSDHSRVAAMVIDGACGRELLLANLTDGRVDVVLEDPASGYRATRLDADTSAALETVGDPWRGLRQPAGRGIYELTPYAIASFVAPASRLNSR